MHIIYSCISYECEWMMYFNKFDHFSDSDTNYCGDKTKDSVLSAILDTQHLCLGIPYSITLKIS